MEGCKVQFFMMIEEVQVNVWAVNSCKNLGMFTAGNAILLQKMTINMLTDKEEAFLKYWEGARNRQKKLIYQLAVGLPFGLIFGVLIIANFYSGWYTRADMISNSRFNPVVLYVAVALIAVFFAIFSKKFEYDQQQQKYLELTFKKKKAEKKEDAANEAEIASKDEQ